MPWISTKKYFVEKYFLPVIVDQKYFVEKYFLPVIVDQKYFVEKYFPPVIVDQFCTESPSQEACRGILRKNISSKNFSSPCFY